MAQMKITDGKGVHFTFDNGLTLSIQIGRGNYSDNYDHQYDITAKSPLPPSRTAELGLWGADGEWFSLDSGDVKGNVPVSEIIRFIPFLAALDAGQTRDTFAAVYPSFDWTA